MSVEDGDNNGVEDVEETSSSNILSSLSKPIGIILKRADDGSIFREWLKYALIGLAIAIPFSTFQMAYELTKSPAGDCKELNAGKYEHVLERGEPLVLYLKAKRIQDKCSSLGLSYGSGRGYSYGSSRKSPRKSGRPWLLVVGLILTGLGIAQVMLYRAGRLDTSTRGKYPVTPMLAQVIRAGGEAAAVMFTIMGVFVGLQVLAMGAGAEPALKGAFSMVEKLGEAAIVGGPILGFFILLFTHYASELSVAVVAIANNTSKDDAA